MVWTVVYCIGASEIENGVDLVVIGLGTISR